MPQKNDWNASRKECRDKESDLVIIENKEELVRSKLMGLLPGLLHLCAKGLLDYTCVFSS